MAGTTAHPGHVVATLAKALENALAEADLSAAQYRALALLTEGSAAASMLATGVAISRPSATALVDGLVARGFVERHDDPNDRRRVELVVTPEGLRMLAAADDVVTARLKRIVSCLNVAEATAAMRGLEMLGRAIERLREKRLREQSETG
jgi:long-chain acyl-CoA synthetase